MTRLEYLKEQKRLTEDKLNVNIVQMRKHKRDIEILDGLICEEEEKQITKLQTEIQEMFKRACAEIDRGLAETVKRHEEIMTLIKKALTPASN